MQRLTIFLVAAVISFFAAMLLTSPRNSSTPTTSTAAATLQVGFALRDITPEVGNGKPPVYLAGFGHNRIADGVNDPLYAQAVVLSDGTSKIALVSLDIVGLFYPNTLNIRAGLPGFTGVIVSSTHNHEGPDTMGLWGSSPLKNGINQEYLKRVEADAIAAVKEAEQKLSTVTARFGKASAPKLLFDSREPYLLHDDLYVLKFEDAAGKTKGILMNWHCHPETLADKNTRISADYVGYCRAELAKKHDCPVAYFTGTVGGLMTTLHLQVRDEQGTLMPENSLAKTIEYGHQLAKVAHQAVGASVPVALTPLHYAGQAIYLPLANPAYKLGRTMGVLDREAYQWKGNPLQAGDKLPSRLGTGEMAMASEVGLLTLGDVQVACIPGEIYPETVLGGTPNPAEAGADYPDAAIEPVIYHIMKAKHKMLFGLANDEIGYIVPKRQWDEKPPYCYGRKKSQYGEGNSCGPETAPIICEAFKSLVK